MMSRKNGDREHERKDDYVSENKRGRKIDLFKVSYYSHSVTFHPVKKTLLASIPPLFCSYRRSISRTTTRILF